MPSSFNEMVAMFENLLVILMMQLLRTDMTALAKGVPQGLQGFNELQVRVDSEGLGSAGCRAPIARRQGIQEPPVIQVQQTSIAMLVSCAHMSHNDPLPKILKLPRLK